MLRGLGASPLALVFPESLTVAFLVLLSPSWCSFLLPWPAASCLARCARSPPVSASGQPACCSCYAALRVRPARGPSRCSPRLPLGLLPGSLAAARPGLCPSFRFVMFLSGLRPGPGGSNRRDFGLVQSRTPEKPGSQGSESRRLHGGRTDSSGSSGRVRRLLIRDRTGPGSSSSN